MINTHVSKPCSQGPKEGGKHVNFVGPQGELKAGDGTYGTSIPMSRAMDPANDVLIAYKQVSGVCCVRA